MYQSVLSWLSLRRRLTNSVLWPVILLVSSLLGYLSVSPDPRVSTIVFTVPPAEPCDQSLVVDLWNEQHSYIAEKESVALVKESSDKRENQVLFFCPRTRNSEGRLQLRFPLDKRHRIKHAYLYITSYSFYEFDPQAHIVLSIQNPKSIHKEVFLAELSRHTGENRIDAFEVTSHLEGAQEFRILIRGTANKLLYHPTPNHPIGYAGSQFLRQRGDESYAAKLDLWYETEP